MAGEAEGIFVEERQRLIVTFVNENSKATVSELCEKFGVSPATIRNDLRELADGGQLRRTYGGAISNAKAAFEPTLNEARFLNNTLKEKIAREAVKHVHEGECIAIDAGSTMFELAKQLTGFNHLTVVTNDLNIALYLTNNARCDVVMAGGIVRSGFQYTSGEKAMLTIEDLNVDTAFVAANGVSMAKGLTTPQMGTAEIKKVMINNSRKAVLLADSTKFETISFVTFANIDEVDMIITDDSISSGMLKRMQNYDVEIAVAK